MQLSKHTTNQVKRAVPCCQIEKSGAVGDVLHSHPACESLQQKNLAASWCNENLHKHQPTLHKVLRYQVSITTKPSKTFQWSHSKRHIDMHNHIYKYQSLLQPHPQRLVCLFVCLLLSSTSAIYRGLRCWPRLSQWHVHWSQRTPTSTRTWMGDY